MKPENHPEIGALLIGAAALVSPAQAAPIRTDREQEFEYRHQAGEPKSAPKMVHLAGSFNGWSRTATPMVKVAEGVWKTSVVLPEGMHEYKFVLDGRTWVMDPREGALELEDAGGNKNSAVIVGVDGRKLPAPKVGAINLEALRHEPLDGRDCNVVAEKRVRLAIRAQAGDVTRAVVHASDGAGWRTTEMAGAGESNGFTRFVAVVGVAGPVRYVFELGDGAAMVFQAGGKTFESLEAAKTAAYACDMAVTFAVPAWAKDAVWYQIFPERFRNGDATNDPSGVKPWKSKWFSMLPGESGEFWRDVFRRRYGGDIAGIKEKLPYLRELGVNAIYLNPVFEAESLHKYDGSDFRHIDDHFGVAGSLKELQGETDDPATWKWSKSDLLFLDFVAEAKRQGFKVIIDGVWNHVGRRHHAFQEVLRNGRKSKYADWFEITAWEPRVQWMAWDGPNGQLPLFKKDAKRGLAEGPREHVMAVTRRWLAPDGDPSRGVDGFRLDVAAELAHPFWAEWRKLVKEIKPEAYITGEVWTSADPWLRGDEFDAVMNYPFAVASKAFFVRKSEPMKPTAFGGALVELANRYPMQAGLVGMNLLDSHDTDRFASMLMNPDIAYDGASHLRGDGSEYNRSKPGEEEWRRMKLAAVMQFTGFGAPMVYYGTEAGMWGPDDPSNRQPMVWEDLGKFEDEGVVFDRGLFGHYQRLIAVRHALPALRGGTIRVVHADDEAGTFGFVREMEGVESVYVVLNRSGKAKRVKTRELAGKRGVNWLNAEQVSLKMDGERPRAVAVGDAAVDELLLPPDWAAIITLGK